MLKKVEEQRLSGDTAGRTSGGRYQSYYNTFNFLDGDGGEYELLAKAKEKKMQKLNNSGGQVEEGDKEENYNIQHKDETDDSDNDEFEMMTLSSMIIL